MADHVFRYFRLAIFAINSGSIWQMSVLNFLDDSGQRFVYPSGTTYTVSRGSYSSGENPSKILDNSTSTKLCIGFSVETLPQYITYDMLTPVLDLSIYTKWCWYTANDTSSYSGRNIKTYNLEVSNDGENWTIIDSQENGSYTSSNYTLAYTGNCGAYLINAFANPEGSGTFVNDGYHIHDTRVALTAQPSLGYKFINWLLKDYTQLEYIESSNTQYIDSNYIPNNKTRVITEVYFPESEVANHFFFGARSAASVNTFVYLIKSGEGYSRTDFGQTQQSFTKTFGRIVIDKNRNKTYVNNNLVATNTDTTFNAPNSMIIFGCNTAGTITYSPLIGTKCYYFKIYDNDVLVRDFIPVFKHSTGEIGLLDLCQLKFYGNSGTGTFKAGRKVVKYKTLDYIESSGTQYINTDFKPNHLTKVDLKVMPLDIHSSTYRRLFGVTGADTITNAYRISGITSRFTYALGNGETEKTSGVGLLTNNTLYEIQMDKTNGIFVNGSRIINSFSTTFSSSFNMYICCTNGNGSPSGYISEKIYYFKIYNDGTLVRDYIPAQEVFEDGDLGQIGLFDKVSKTLFTNAGTGTFNKGDVTGEIDLDGGEL